MKMVKVRYKGGTEILTHYPPGSANTYSFVSGGDWVEVSDPADAEFYTRYSQSKNSDFEIESPQTIVKDFHEKVTALKDRITRRITERGLPSCKKKKRGR